MNLASTVGLKATLYTQPTVHPNSIACGMSYLHAALSRLAAYEPHTAVVVRTAAQLITSLIMNGQFIVNNIYQDIQELKIL